MKVREHCICGSAMSRQPFSANFEALRCDRCESRNFIAHPNGEVREFRYNADSNKYAEHNYLFGKHLRWSHRELLAMPWTGRMVLEIGCFNGFFLDELRQAGADVYGFDVNEAALEVGRSLYALEGRLHSSLEDLKALGPFDDILCVDVLEHVDSPEAFLSELTSMLRPGGRAMIAGPTLERGFHDKSDYPPHHKWWFSRSGLQTFLRLHDYHVTDVLIQRDGLLLLRNFIGRLVYGMRRREFYGDAAVLPPGNTGPVSSRVYGAATTIGQWVCSALRVSYCSTVMIASRSKASGG
jgi:SAM-dependent methyltransferase